MKNPELADYREVMRQCVKCGACQAKCPAYRLTRREGAVARGKIALAQALADGEIGIENTLLPDLDFCLLCGGCATACPNAVPTPEIVAAARRHIGAQRGGTTLEHGISRLTASPKLMKMAAKTAAAGQSILSGFSSKSIPAESGLRLRLPQAMAGRLLPRIPHRNLFDRLPEKIAGQPGKPTVGFFAGCGLTYLFPHIGEKAVALLTRFGYEVIIAKSQGCCGIPAASCGDGAAVERLAARNVSAFKEADVIVTACASCFSGIGDHYRAMGVVDFTGKVVEFSDFLLREKLLGLMAGQQERPGEIRPPRRVTWHDPCHLKRHGLTSGPRKILKALPDVELVEMAGASLCCGLGGSFSLKHYAASKAIGTEKIAGLTASKAEYVVTACPGCLIQLQDIISQAGLPMRATHLVEML
ncbi:MAG: (Fe-S)-binding protein [Desulfobulbaceae bacterium]|jgi:glycolate oxidase iron-sulfur subunit|nr:(Fe-S)-binding protein [Desulfobulbaceae bacterium]